MKTTLVNERNKVISRTMKINSMRSTRMKTNSMMETKSMRKAKRLLSLRQKKRNPQATKVVRGKYTVHNNGTTKYGGWSEKGMARFNELYKLVKEDRKCPQAVAMEKEFPECAIFYTCDSKQRNTANNAGTVIG
jgi:phage tail tube protein FII